MKAKGPAAAKAEQEKKKGLALFGPKPSTPKLLRAVGGNINRTIIDKLKVGLHFFKSALILSSFCHCKVKSLVVLNVFKPDAHYFSFFPECRWPVRIPIYFF